MARIGIFGGSFNPPHMGHILALREFLTKLALDRVVLIPAGDPPHKTLSANSPTAAQRLQMSRLAVQDVEKVYVSDIEISREGRSYTADTITLLREEYPNDELFLLMGTDMFYSFASWYQPERIVAEAKICVAYREKEQTRKLQACAQSLRDTLGAEILFVENEYLPHSSTSVRAMLAFGCAESYLPPAVLQYIQENGLYYTGSNLKGLPFAELREISLSLHKSKRVDHVIGCSDTAMRLAKKFGADEDAARRAGILHDITKALNADEQLKLCERYAIVLSEFEARHPKLLHAKTGAVIAREVFGETPAVCEAIEWHTTGRADMSLLEKIIYLADYIEPNRQIDGIEELRALTEQSLDAGMLRGLNMTLAHVRSGGAEVDPNSLAAVRFFQERI